MLTIFCACLIAAGFFFAGLQHFATMDLGFKNSELRKAVEELEAEKRRLILAREVSLSPSEIMRTARSLGYREAEAIVPTPVLTVAPQSSEVGDRPVDLASATPTQDEVSQPARRSVPETAPLTRARSVTEKPVEKTMSEGRPRQAAAKTTSSVRSTETVANKTEKKKTEPPPAESRPSAETADTRPRRVSAERQARAVLNGLK